ncbi:MAG: type ISP restriction/modification enzyme, partial [bacterium]|nr:type ISP restriction/modification enzyme [bacterium]
HALITSYMTEHGVLSSKTTNYHFPLYLFDTKAEKNPGHGSTMMMVFEPQAEYQLCKPNIAAAVFNKLEEAFGKRPAPEAILYYIYAIFYSNIYRRTYAEFLKIDFPRVPFTADYKLFKTIGKFGKRLVDLHLLNDSKLSSPVAKYPLAGANDRIEKISYQEDEQRIYINKEKYFEGVSPEVWNYHIGGYQVLHKYLKDRKGRDMDDAPHYCWIITALSKTIELQQKIDEIYPEVESELIDF